MRIWIKELELARRNGQKGQRKGKRTKSRVKATRKPSRYSKSWQQGKRTKSRGKCHTQTAKTEKAWQRKADLSGRQGSKAKEDGRKTASQPKRTKETGTRIYK